MNSATYKRAEVEFDLENENIKFVSRRIDDIESVTLNGKRLPANVKTNVQNVNML